MSADALQQAIALCKAGEKQKADILLRQILQADPHNESAWLWLADAQPDAAARLRMLRAFLRSNPDSQIAKTALAQLSPPAPAKPAAGTAPKTPVPARPAAGTALKPAVPAKPGILPLASPPKAPRRSSDFKIVAGIFGGVIFLGMATFLVLWILRGQGTLPAQALPTAGQPSPQAQLPTQTSGPRFLPTQAPTPTRGDCECGEALDYLERTGERIVALQDDMLLASDSIEQLPLSKPDFASLSGWGRVRYDEQFADQPPPCLVSFQQKMNTFFASWWHAMDAISLGEYNNAMAFLTSFREKEAEIYAEAQTLMENFQKCAPLDDGGENQTG